MDLGTILHISILAWSVFTTAATIELWVARRRLQSRNAFLETELRELKKALEREERSNA